MSDTTLDVCAASMDDYHYLHTLQHLSPPSIDLSEQEFLFREQLLNAASKENFYDQFVYLLDTFAKGNHTLSAEEAFEQFIRLFLTVAFTDETIEQACLNDPKLHAFFEKLAKEARIPFVDHPFPYLCAIYVRGRELPQTQNSGSVRYLPCKEAPTQVLNWVFDYCDYLQHLSVKKLSAEKLPDGFAMIDFLEHYPLLQQLAHIKCTSELIFYFLIQKEKKEKVPPHLSLLKQRMFEMETLEKQWKYSPTQDPSPLLLDLELGDFSGVLEFFKLQTKDATFAKSSADLHRFYDEINEEVKPLLS